MLVRESNLKFDMAFENYENFFVLTYYFNSYTKSYFLFSIDFYFRVLSWFFIQISFFNVAGLNKFVKGLLSGYKDISIFEISFSVSDILSSKNSSYS